MSCPETIFPYIEIIDIGTYQHIQIHPCLILQPGVVLVPWVMNMNQHKMSSSSYHDHCPHDEDEDSTSYSEPPRLICIWIFISST